MYWFVESPYVVPKMVAYASTAARRTTLSVGGFVAATRCPWYLRVLEPATVPIANPPRPFGNIHSSLEETE